jgi:hypothetical protein
VIRLLWLLVVGSWRFPWENEFATCVYKSPDYPYPPCDARASKSCSDGRCRHHCGKHCKCEERPLIEAPREPKSHTDGSAYR